MGEKSCPITVKEYDADGQPVTSGDVHAPAWLDWMPIDVKVEWFKRLGRGDPRTKSVLLVSQGEQRLLTSVSLRPLDHREYKERLNELEDEIQRFIDEGGYSRKPRNQ
jgi:hypothetical protein